jgi:hypothetical protein
LDHPTKAEFVKAWLTLHRTATKEVAEEIYDMLSDPNREADFEKALKGFASDFTASRKKPPIG